MNPNTRFSLGILLALGVNLPTVVAGMNGEADLGMVALRFLVAFVLFRAAIGVIAQLLETYRTPDGVDSTGATPRRRAGDGPEQPPG